MCGGGDVQVPEPTPEERELQAQQLAILKQQQAENEQLKPILLAQLGYKVVNGQLVPMTEAERYATLSERERQQAELERRSAEAMLSSQTLNQERLGLEKQQMDLQRQILEAQLSGQRSLEERLKDQADIDRAMQERQLAALEGRLPVSPALEQNINNQRKKLEQTLSSRLGPNWMLSTPGIQAIQQFEQSAELSREEARRGQLAMGAQILSPYQATQLSPAQVAYPLVNRESTAPALGLYSSQNYGLLDRVPGLLQPYQTQRQMGLQADMANTQNRTSLAGATLGMLGGVAGIGAGLGITRWLK